MIDLSNNIIIDEFSQKHRVHSAEDVKKVLNSSTSPLVILRNGNVGGFSLIGISAPKGEQRRFTFSNQQDLCLQGISVLLNQSVFKTAPVKTPNKANGKASESAMGDYKTKDTLFTETEYKRKLR
ncbi:hypothetical protein SAMN06297229_1322 [Pseudidiomarina planktonica]|uniref:Uncharacterized protein n=1 Tax=Pseudidiomarina planktonica TaxID=1323738 RepID=A0A1Y6ESH3_9GAMM|nr:hypothetical protein [Pseudidiomarina planktonica]RUO65286.1 hypothetical protein CWI77_02160 [Pseudidiomarina planktonica]SMQ65654.1 hypothetical protein SAMN06297229_1322 [Pseudidiomarina planktonica]